jgi:hypothetical protein
MFKQKPFIFSLFVLVFIIALHLVGSYYSWYWLYPRFDIVVHVFSGLWVGLIFLWLASVFGQVNSLKEYKAKSFLIAFIPAIIFGVAWELLEVFNQITFTDAVGYGLDTAGDIFNAGLGGILAYLYFIKKTKCSDKACDAIHPFYNQTGVIKN